MRFVEVKKVTLEFACDKIPRFCGALIAGDESKRARKRGANDLWGT